MTHTRPERAPARSRVGTVLEVGSRVAVTGWSYSREEERRLNVQSGFRKSKVNKRCGHLARAPSVIVGTEKVFAGS